MYFMHAPLYLLKLSIDHVSLGGCGQVCPLIPKEAFKILIDIVKPKYRTIYNNKNPFISILVASHVILI